MLLAMTGTFDVENYGDILFPMLAKHELGKRLGAVDIHLFSYNARSTPPWPYPVLPLTELAARAKDYDGMIVGGGDVVRFDKGVAPGYGPGADWIHHPTGYWLAPSLMALQHGIPLVWNAPGCASEVPGWASFLMQTIVAEGAYISVRDPYSLQNLLGGKSAPGVRVVPDSAFGIANLVDPASATAEFAAVREHFGLQTPYIAVQAAARDVTLLKKMVADNQGGLGKYQSVILPIGPAVGDIDSATAPAIAGAVTFPFFNNPLLLAEVIANADAVIGHSLHLSITALASGVPVFSTANLWSGKRSVLLESSHVYPFPIEGEVYVPWFLKRVGRFAESPDIAAKRAQVTAHWDAVAAVLRSGRAKAAIGMNRFWFTLPTALEEAFAAHAAQAAQLRMAQNQTEAAPSRLGRLTPRRVARGLARRIKQWVKR